MTKRIAIYVHVSTDNNRLKTYFYKFVPYVPNGVSESFRNTPTTALQVLRVVMKVQHLICCSKRLLDAGTIYSCVGLLIVSVDHFIT